VNTTSRQRHARTNFEWAVPAQRRHEIVEREIELTFIGASLSSGRNSYARAFGDLV